MKKNCFARYIPFVSILVGIILVLVSCSKDQDQSSIKVYEYREQIGKKMKQVNDLKNASTYGNNKGMYPTESKSLLENTWTDLKNLLQQIKEADWSDEEIASQTQSRLAEADAQIQSFYTTIRTADLRVEAELAVNGKNGGYIDFGAHPEYSSFGTSGHQQFTIDLWIKLKDLEGFFFLLSTFTDDENNNHERQGWCINSYNYGANNVRMTYGMGFNDLMEPATPFTTINQWVHLAIVTNEDGVDNESENGQPIMTKIYINGELRLKTTSHQSADKPYYSNDRNISMVAFTGLNTSGDRIGDKGANGYMKYIHIWTSAKSSDQIKTIMDNPMSITGQETDLVCGWNFDSIPENDNQIIDLTGKYSARLIGDYQWIPLN